MKKQLLAIGLLTLGFASKAQVLYVTKPSSSGVPTMTILSNTLVYAGGGVTVDNYGDVNNYGNVMVVGTSSDSFSVHESGNSTATANFNLKFDKNDLTHKTYGQLYITGLPQNKITGLVNKEYLADVSTPDTSKGLGRQQTSLPFYNFTGADLIKNAPFNTANFINITDASLTHAGRWNYGSVFKWNNARARFDQILAGTTITPTDYIIIPQYSNTVTPPSSPIWNPSGGDPVVFTGRPASDDAATSSNYILQLNGGFGNSTGNSASAFGYAGSNQNYYREKYSTYLDDPFDSNNKWTGTYGLNLYQYANPFLTNLDISLIGVNGNGDGNNVSNLRGIAYYGSGALNWFYGGQSSNVVGTTYYSNTVKIATADGTGKLVYGDGTQLALFKPMSEFMIKLKDSNSQTVNLANDRRFSFTPRTSSTTTVTGRMASKTTSSTVKQLAVVLQTSTGNEVARTYYAVAQEATTGYLNAPATQAYVSDNALYTTEESINGGADSSQLNTQMYINVANETDFAGKMIPMVVADKLGLGTQFKFELYEDGRLLDNSTSLSTGKSFYISDANNIITKINAGDVLPLNGTQYGLYYDQPASTLGTENVTKSSTIVTKSNSDWIVKIANDWKNSTIEVYAATGQLIYSKKGLTPDTYTLPLNNQTHGIYVVKVSAEKGQIVVKKIIK